MTENGTKAKRTRTMGELRIEAKITHGWGEVASPPPPFESVAAAKKWLTENANEGAIYRLVRVVDTYTPQVTTVRKVSF